MVIFHCYVSSPEGKKKPSNNTRMSESAVPLVPNRQPLRSPHGQLVFLDWQENVFCLVSNHHKTTEIGLPSCFCPYRMGNISHKPEIQRSFYVCLFCWHVPCNVIQPKINHTYMCRLLGCTVIVQQMWSFCFSGISSPSSKYSSVWQYSLVKFQWLGVRQRLQETPIFHGKIPWSSLSIFLWTIPLIQHHQLSRCIELCEFILPPVSETSQGHRQRGFWVYKYNIQTKIAFVNYCIHNIYVYIHIQCIIKLSQRYFWRTVLKQYQPWATGNSKTGVCVYAYIYISRSYL